MMDIFLLYIPYIIATVIGYLAVELIFTSREKPIFMLRLFLGAAVGLAACGALTFSSFIIFNQFHKTYLIISACALMTALLGAHIFTYIRWKDAFWKIKPFDLTQFFFFITILILSIPFWYLVHFYADGGWDAWSTWNLKSKFLFLGGQQWDGLFHDKLWRSSPHYPLLLPLINVWGWLFQSEPIYKGPCFTAYFSTMIMINLMTFGIYAFTKSRWSLLSAPILLLMGFYIKMSLSQYADNMVALYLLAGLICILFTRIKHDGAYALLAGFFLGILSFAKNEGLLAGVLVLALAIPYIYWKNPNPKRFRIFIPLAIGALIGFIPNMIFAVLYAPDNLTFINGFTSQTRPVTKFRIKTILGYYTMELAMPIWRIFAPMIEDLRGATFVDKWNGIWVVMGLAVAIGWRHCLDRRWIIIPVFIIVYMAIITFYYAMNTYFQVDWWMQVTLHRLVSVILPIMIFWCFLSFWPDKVGK